MHAPPSDTETNQRQLPKRLAIGGLIIIALFSVLGFRLWSLEFLTGNQHRGKATANHVRDIRLQAPRGAISDRNGAPLVENTNNLVVQIRPDKLPDNPAQAQDLYNRLAPLLKVPPQALQQRVHHSLQMNPFANATLKDQVDLGTVSYVLEHQDQFPGVTANRDNARIYPQGDTAAQLLGTIGQPSQKQLHSPHFPDTQPGDVVGQAGLEYSYNQLLRGTPGMQRLQVTAGGTPTGASAFNEPKSGQNLKLAIDSRVQQAGQHALGGRPGSFVVMDTTNGSVVAMGSSPTYDANALANATTERDYAKFTSPQSGSPLTNRAAQGESPPGSSFKLITSVAALQSNLIQPSTIVNDQGSVDIDGIRFPNFESQNNGPINMRNALRVSSDVYFYNLGAQMNTAQGGHVLQDWSNRLGIGQPTGVDLPDESDGLVPSREWRNRLFHEHRTSRAWGTGDDVNLAVGQGDLEVDPLQLAGAYAAVANGGTLVTPHLGLSTDDGHGHVNPIQPPPRSQVDIAPRTRQTILDGLHAGATEPGGTSASSFANFPIPIAGKTGTAQSGGSQPDGAWYAALAPYPNPRYVAVTNIEHGGQGEKVAAPATREILQALFAPPPPPPVPQPPQPPPAPR
jgi:penicillin-binding protein 2